MQFFSNYIINLMILLFVSLFCDVNNCNSNDSVQIVFIESLLFQLLFVRCVGVSIIFIRSR